MKVLTLEQFITEGAGAGYTVKFKGMEFNFSTAQFTGKREFLNNAEHWEIKMEICYTIIDKWETHSYYEGITSDGDDNMFFYDDNEDLAIHGGESLWLVNKDDFIEYITNHYDYGADVNEKLDIKPMTPDKLKDTAKSVVNSKKFTEYLQRFLNDECSEKYDLEFDYGGGYSHSNLPNPIVLDSSNRKHDPIAEYADEYGNLYMFCTNMSIDCEQIVNDINYFYGNAMYAYGDYDTYYDEDSGMEFLQLSDEHILWDVNSSYDEDEYQALRQSALEKLTNKYGTEFYLCGKSGRHVCVDDGIENRKRYDEMKSDVKEEQKNIIRTLNGK